MENSLDEAFIEHTKSAYRQSKARKGVLWGALSYAGFLFSAILGIFAGAFGFEVAQSGWMIVAVLIMLASFVFVILGLLFSIQAISAKETFRSKYLGLVLSVLSLLIYILAYLDRKSVV